MGQLCVASRRVVAVYSSGIAGVHDEFCNQGNPIQSGPHWASSFAEDPTLPPPPFSVSTCCTIRSSHTMTAPSGNTAKNQCSLVLGLASLCGENTESSTCACGLPPNGLAYNTAAILAILHCFLVRETVPRGCAGCLKEHQEGGCAQRISWNLVLPSVAVIQY